MEEKKRSRKKQIYHDIVNQVEFYFSPANLSKDRFMSQTLIDNPNGIDLSVLMTFNKLKALTTDVNIVTKALKLSEKLELTDNDTKVKSKVPFVPKQNEEECTIYVERLQLDANVEFLTQVFSSYGKIDYVSLPKFQNGKIKGFAFVEFAEPEGAERAIEDFKKTGSYLPIDMAPGNLRSICTFDKKSKERFLNAKSKNFDFYDMGMESRDEEDVLTVAEEMNNVDLEQCGHRGGEMNSDNDSDDKKRKNETSPSTLERRKKKIRADSNSDSSVKLSDSVSSDKPSDNLDKSADSTADRTNQSVSDQSFETLTEERKNAKSDDGETDTMEHVEESDSNVIKSKKKRRAKKKPKKDRPTAHSGLLILSKSDWKRLRNKYLNVQWDKMRSLKKHLNRCKWRAQNQDGFNNGTAYTSHVEIPNSVVKILSSHPVVDVKQFKAEIKSKSSDIVNIDVKEGSMENHVRFNSADAATKFVTAYGKEDCKIISGEEERIYWFKIMRSREMKREKQATRDSQRAEEETHEEAMTSESKDSRDVPAIPITPGSVVRLATPETIIDVRQFKNDIKRSYTDVVYVDVKEGSSEAFIRLISAESAVNFSTNNSYGKAEILTGKDEEAYCNKINEDRLNKFKFSKQFRSNKRGKDKIMKKAANMMGKHVIFDDPDDMIVSK